MVIVLAVPRVLDSTSKRADTDIPLSVKVLVTVIFEASVRLFVCPEKAVLVRL